MSKKVLEIVNLTKMYNDKTILRKLNFEVYAGEIFGFIGPNGAGKSTLIRIICGLSKATKGDVFICGYSITKKFEKAIANVGAVVENGEMYSYMSGMQNLQYYAKLSNRTVTKEDIKKIVETVGLTARINDKVKTYSLGMRQRLCLAQALLNKPNILILDEPTNGLDVNGTIELRQILKKLAQKEHIAIFISSHILAEMEQLCDTVAIFNKGSILEIRTLDDIQRQNNKYKKLRIQVNSPNLSAKLLQLKFGMQVEIDGNAVLVPYLPELTQKYIEALQEKGVTISGVDIINRNLENVYLDIIENNSKINNKKSV